MCRIRVMLLSAVMLWICADIVSASNSEFSIMEAIEESAKKTANDLPRGSRVAIAAFETENNNLSDFIMEELTGALFERGLEVADRQNLEYVYKELDFQMSGDVKDDDAKSVGNFLAADMVITGQLINVGGKYRYRTSAVRVEQATRASVIRLDIRNDAEMRRMVAALAGQSTDAKAAGYGTNTKTDVAGQTENSSQTTAAKTTSQRVRDGKTLSSAGTFLDRGILFASRGEYRKAVADFGEALKRNPKMAIAYTLRGRVLIAGLSEAVDVEKNFGEVSLVSSDWATSAADKRVYDQAIADFSLAIRLDPGNAMNYRERGLAYTLKREYDLALADFDRIIKINPNDVTALSTRSIVHFEKQNYDEAIADCGRVIRLKPQDAAAYNKRGLVYTKKGNHERARSNIDAAVSAHEKSIADFQDARRLDPKNSQIGFNLKQAEVNKESAKTSATIRGKDIKATSKNHRSAIKKN